MNEDYFKIYKNGHIHTLSNRIPFKWKELLAFSSVSLIMLLLLVGWLTATLITIIGYTIYRFASWIYYSEIQIDEKNGTIIRLKKLFNQIRKEELITNQFNPNRFEYLAIVRSGKTKFVLNYKTHKNNELLILKNEEDKNLVEKYLAEKVIFKNT